ncbi:MAG: hypothetical protein ABIO41_09160, partial [Ignavibacteria bacterium]
MLTLKHKKEILKFIEEENYLSIILILEKIKTSHAGTAKTKDKRFVIGEIVKSVIRKSKNYDKDFFDAGSLLCKQNEDVAKEIGISLVWRGYKTKPEKVNEVLLKIADDPNWEVREYAGSAFANALYDNPDLYKIILAWTKHPSE